MTAPSRGRGRPAVFDTAAQEIYLKAREAGATQKAAAAEVGVTARTVRNALASNPDFKAADTEAGAQSRKTRIGARHDAYTYKHYGCRCPTCTKAASAARAQNADRARKEARVTPISPPSEGSSSSFPLARAS